MKAIRWMAVALLGCAGAALAKPVSHVVDVTVTVTNIYGREFTQPIKVTVFRDDARGRAPFLILNHGRAATVEEQKKMGRAAYTENSRYFVAKGFVVLVPTRVGYGVSGGDDVEYSGTCEAKNYPPVYEAAVQQTLRVIEYARTLAYVDARRGLVVGQSFGGTTAIAIAAKQVEGVVAAVLWLYSENDQYMGKRYPREWFDAFVAKGGNGRFVQLPALGEDGHGSFTRNPPAWRPAFEDFLRDNGF
jgi:hypothetical protein